MSCFCHEYEKNLLTSKNILQLMEQSFTNKKGFSLTRFSHAEIAYLNWKIDPSIIKLMNKYEQYNGVTEPMPKVMKKLYQSLLLTDIAGFIPKSVSKIATTERDLNGSWWYEKTTNMLHHLSYMPQKVSSVWVTQEMIYDEVFWKLINGKRIALIGRRAKEAVPFFENKGVNVTEVMSLEGIKQVKGVFKHLYNNSSNWDVALVSAGIPSTILTPQLAQTTNKIVIDFGHALDRIIDNDQYNFDSLFNNWKRD